MLAGTLDDATFAIATQVAVVVLVPLVIPWDYVIANYFKKPGVRWSGSGANR